MDMRIEVKDWKYEKKDNGTPTITGTYAVMLGKKEIANKSFNDAYGSMDIVFPSELVARIETIGVEIIQLIKKEFE